MLKLGTRHQHWPSRVTGNSPGGNRYADSVARRETKAVYRSLKPIPFGDVDARGNINLRITFFFTHPWSRRALNLMLATLMFYLDARASFADQLKT